MSYSIEATASGGQVTVITAGDVPDGTYTVSGHDDATYQTIGVSRRLPSGQSVVSASVTTHGSA